MKNNRLIKKKMSDEEYKLEEEISNISKRLGLAEMSQSESESEDEEPPQNDEEISAEQQDFENHLNECLTAIRTEERGGIVFGINNLSEALSAHPEYAIEVLDDTTVLTLMSIFLEEFDPTVTSNLMLILHILLNQLSIQKKEMEEKKKGKENETSKKSHIFIEVGIFNNVDNALKNATTPIPILYAIDIVTLMTEFMETWPEFYEFFTNRGYVSAILDIVNSKCPETIPDRPSDNPEFTVQYQEDSIDLTDNEDLLLAQCLRFLNLFIIQKDFQTFGCIMEAIDFMIVFPFIERYPNASAVALECLVKFTENAFNEDKLDLFSRNLKIMNKIKPLMQLAYQGAHNAWLVIANLLSGGYLINEFYTENELVPFLNDVLTNSFDIIKQIESSKDPSEEDIETRTNALDIHHLAMATLGAAAYDEKSYQYVSMYTESSCIDIIMEDILESTMKVRKEACIAIAHLFDSGDDSIIQYLFEKNPEFPLQALQNLPALNENEQEAVINALTKLMEALVKNAIMDTIESIGGTEGMEIIDEYLEQAPANLYASMLSLKHTIACGQPNEEEDH